MIRIVHIYGHVEKWPFSFCDPRDSDRNERSFESGRQGLCRTHLDYPRTKAHLGEKTAISIRRHATERPSSILPYLLITTSRYARFDHRPSSVESGNLYRNNLHQALLLTRLGADHYLN